MLVLVLKVFCQVTVCTCSVCCESCLAFLALADLGDNALTARFIVLCSWLGLAIALYVTALYASVCESMYAEVDVVDAEAPCGCRW